MKLALLALLILPLSCKKADDVPAVTPTPAITALSPTTGGYGTQVTIMGSNFGSSTAQNMVTFNGKTATIVSISANSIVAQVPDGAGTGPVTVTTDGKTGSSPGAFTYQLTATITKLTATGVYGGFKAGQGTSANLGIPMGLFTNPATKLLYTWDNGSSGKYQLRSVSTDGAVADVTPAIGWPRTVNGKSYQVDYYSFSPSGRLYTGLIETYVLERVGWFNTDGSLALLNYTDPAFGVNLVVINGIYARSDSEVYLMAFVSVTNTSQEKRLYRITPSGFTLVAGGPGVSTANSVYPVMDGKGTNARFGGSTVQPHPMVADKAGNLLILDYGCIRKVAPDGTVTTLAGSGTPALATATSGRQAIKDGQGKQAVLGAGNQLTIDANDNLYLTGSRNGNHFIQKITPGGLVSTVLSAYTDQNTNLLTGDSGLLTIKNNQYNFGSSVSGAVADEQGTVYALINDALYKISVAH